MPGTARAVPIGASSTAEAAPIGAAPPADVSAPPSPIAALPAKPDGRITDLAAILTADQRTSLDHALAAIEARTNRQVVVVTVPTLNGKAINDVARDLGNDWGIGQAGEDDGVVILLALNEQLVRIAVGQGLEAILTDDLCQQIIDEAMIPEFARGSLFEGLSKGVDALAREL